MQGAIDANLQLAAYPGFNPHAPTPLPHGLETLQQMKRVTSAQSKLATKVSKLIEDGTLYCL